MKRLIMATLFMLFVFCALSVRAESDIKIVLDGTELDTEHWDVKPFIQDGRTMVPIRHFAETIGADISWVDENAAVNSRTAYISKEDHLITLCPDTDVLFKGFGSIQMDIPSTIVSGRVVAPLRYLAEAFSIDVIWSAENNEINLYTAMPGLFGVESTEWDSKVRNLTYYFGRSFQRLYDDSPQYMNNVIYQAYVMSSDLSQSNVLTYKNDEQNVNLTITVNSTEQSITVVSENVNITSELMRSVLMHIILGYYNSEELKDFFRTEVTKSELSEAAYTFSGEITQYSCSVAITGEDWFDTGNAEKLTLKLTKRTEPTV